MKLLSPSTAALLAAAGAAAFVATGAASPATATPRTVTLQAATAPAPAPSAGATADASKAGHKRGALSGRGLHADFVVKGKAGTFITAASQRGVVTAVSPTSVTLRSEDGFTRTYAIAAGTKVSSDHAQVDVAAVKTGAKASVVAVKNADAYDAGHISLPKS